MAQPPLDLQSVFNAQPGATLLLSADWMILGASNDYLAATLTQRDTLVGQHIFEAFPDNPDTPEANAVANVRASLEQVLATRQPHEMAPQHYDVPDPAQPGHFVERHWQPRHTPVLDAVGQVQFIIQSVQDLTASRLAERQLRESQAREQTARAEVERQREELQRLFEQAPVAMALFQGTDYRIELANEPMAIIWGRPLPQVLGQPVFEALPDVRNQGFETLFADVLAQGTEHHLPEVSVTIDRAHTGQPTLGYFNLTYRPQRDSQGQITGIFTIAQEVTEQVLARQRVEHLNQELEARVQQRTRELADQQRLLTQILAQVPAAIATLRGPDHRFTFANDRYQQLVEGRVVAGQTVAQTLPEVAEQGFLELLDNVYRTGQPFEGKEITVLLASPDQPPVQHYLDFTYQPMLDEHGQPQGLLVFAVDVTQQVRIRQQANALQAELLATAQRQAQEREAFHNVFEQTPALVALLRAPSHRFEYVNPAYQALFPGRQLVGLDMAEVASEIWGQGFVALLDRVYETGETYYGVDVPFATATPDGEPAHTTYFNFTYQAYRENGQIVGISIFAFDVTEPVLARQLIEQTNQELETRVAARTCELREAQATAERERTLLQALLTQAPVAIGLFQGEELRVTAANSMMAAIWGYTPAQVVGLPLVEGVPELRGQGFDDLLRNVLRTQVPLSGTETPAVMLRDGELKTTYYNFVYQPLYDTHGQVLGVIDVAVEVTEQVLARRQVEQLNQELEARVIERTQEVEVARANTERQRRRLSEVFAQAPVAIGVFAGPAYVLEVVNPPMGEMLGHPAAQLMGQPFFEALPELRGQGLRELLDQVRQTGRPFYAQEQNLHLARHGKGSSGYYNFTYQPLRDSQGQVTAVTCVATDVTEQVRARQQVQHLNEELAAINEEMTATNEELHESNTQLLRTNADLDTFVYAASHDLKAPITNIEGLLDALREYLPLHEQAPMVPRLVGMMEGAIQRFQQTIAHLADVTRLQHGSEPVIGDVDVPGILEDVRLDVLPLMESTQTQLQLEISACPGVRVPVKHLRSILFNLLSNAVKYRAPDRAPVVQVRAQCTTGRFVLEVQDNGLGLSEAQQGYLFTMFKRLHTHVEGSGVGLYLIKRMIDLAGGTIAVASQPGLGSTFTVTLPCA